jgi:hypothetical protein
MKSGKPAAWVPHRPDPRGDTPARLGELLVGAETFIAQKSGSAIPREEWRRLVGARIANRTRVGRLQRGVLTLYVATSAWSNELNFLKQDLIAKLRSLGHEISDLRFLVDQIESKQPGRGPVLRQLQPAAELPPDLLARLQTVDDPNLRAAIAQAARHSLGQPPPFKKKP